MITQGVYMQKVIQQRPTRKGLNFSSPNLQNFAFENGGLFYLTQSIDYSRWTVFICKK